MQGHPKDIFSGYIGCESVSSEPFVIGAGAAASRLYAIDTARWHWWRLRWFVILDFVKFFWVTTAH